MFSRSQFLAIAILIFTFYVVTGAFGRDHLVRKSTRLLTTLFLFQIVAAEHNTWHDLSPYNGFLIFGGCFCT